MIINDCDEETAVSDSTTPTTPKPTYVTARTLKGFRDRLPHESLLKNKMVRTLQGVFEQFGYAPIETPHLEYTEALLGSASAEIHTVRGVGYLLAEIR